MPYDLSVIGMDDIYFASAATPALTTVFKQRYELGKLAAEKLLGFMKGLSEK